MATVRAHLFLRIYTSVAVSSFSVFAETSFPTREDVGPLVT